MQKKLDVSAAAITMTLARHWSAFKGAVSWLNCFVKKKWLRDFFTQMTFFKITKSQPRVKQVYYPQAQNQTFHKENELWKSCWAHSVWWQFSLFEFY